MNIIQKIVHRINRFQERHGFVSFPYALIKKYGDDQGGYQAALITYYGFLSLFPLLLVLTSVLQLVLRHNPSLRDQILGKATTYFPVIGTQLEHGVTGGIKGTGIALIIGIILTLYNARGVADAFRNTVNDIWQVPHVRRTGFPLAVVKSLSIVIIGGLGLLAAPIISGYATAISAMPVFRLLALLITIIILFGVFIFLIKMSLAVKKRFSKIWVSALVAAIGLTILQSLGTFLLKKQLSNLSGLYGTFAIVLGLLYWIYLQSQVIVYALEIDTVRSMRLWPRSLEADNLTTADERAYDLYAKRDRYQKSEDIDVDFSEQQKDPAC